MEILSVVKGLVVFGGGVALYFGLRLIMAIRNADPAEYKTTKNLAGNIQNAFKGNVKPYHDGVRDYRVKAGLAVDLDRNVWVQQGAISKESLNSVFN